MSAPATSSAKSPLITISRDDLTRLLEQAVARGAEQALSVQQVQYLDNTQAAELFYGRQGMVTAWRALRSRYAEIDQASIGHGRFRRWRKAELENLIARLPRFAERSLKFTR